MHADSMTDFEVTARIVDLQTYLEYLESGFAHDVDSGNIPDMERNAILTALSELWSVVEHRGIAYMIRGHQ